MPCHSPRRSRRYGHSQTRRASYRARWRRRQSAICRLSAPPFVAAIVAPPREEAPRSARRQRNTGFPRAGSMRRQRRGASGVDVDVRIDAALADKFKSGQPLKQRRLDFRPLTKENQAFGVLQAGSKRISILNMIVPNDYVVSFQFLETRQCPQCVKVIIEDRNLHEPLLEHTNWYSQTILISTRCARISVVSFRHEISSPKFITFDCWRQCFADPELGRID